MINQAILIEPASSQHLPMYPAYIQACWGDGIEHYEEAVQDPAVHLESIIDMASGDNLPEGMVPSVTYFALCNGEIIGALRHRLGTNHFIREVIGQVGYEVKASARNQGVAKKMLAWFVNHQLNETVIITCEENNRASINVIESVNAQYIGTHIDKTEGSLRRYQISVA